MLQANGYYTTQKYYILNYTESTTIYGYRVSKLYYVTGKYYKLKPQSNPVDYVLNFAETPFGTWETALQLNSGDAGTNSIIDGNYSNPGSADNLIFALDSSSGGSGNAIIDSDGKITLSDDWTNDQYITVVVRMKVSGYDRNIGNDDDAPGYVTLGSVRLGQASA